MRTRKEIMFDVNSWAKPGMGIQQQIATSVLTVELLLDIRELLMANSSLEARQNMASTPLSEKEVQESMMESMDGFPPLKVSDESFEDGITQQESY